MFFEWKIDVVAAAAAAVVVFIFRLSTISSVEPIFSLPTNQFATSSNILTPLAVIIYSMDLKEFVFSSLLFLLLIFFSLCFLIHASYREENDVNIFRGIVRGCVGSSFGTYVYQHSHQTL